MPETALLKEVLYLAQADILVLQKITNAVENGKN